METQQNEFKEQYKAELFPLVIISKYIESHKWKWGGGYKIDNPGCVRIIKCIKGNNNFISFGVGSRIQRAKIVIRGDNNKLLIGKNCIVGPGCSFRLEGNNTTISIGDGSTFTRDCNFSVQEDNMKIEVGNDCMFSNTIVVRTSDSHPIYSGESGERINKPKSVFIGEHVWIAPNTKIMKGAFIEQGTVIGSDTMVNKTIPANSLAVGTPAKIVKENIHWTRESLY